MATRTIITTASRGARCLSRKIYASKRVGGVGLAGELDKVCNVSLIHRQGMTMEEPKKLTKY